MYKLAVISLLVAVGVVFVLSEDCKHAADCQLTICPNSTHTHISCQHDRCTCLAHVACMDKVECDTLAICRDRHAHYHCVDGRCLCLKDEHIEEGDKVDGPGGHIGPGHFGPH